jgi:hypothetical protein
MTEVAGRADVSIGIARLVYPLVLDPTRVAFSAEDHAGVY